MKASGKIGSGAPEVVIPIVIYHSLLDQATKNVLQQILGAQFKRPDPVVSY